MPKGPLCHGSASTASLHHDFRRHLRMNRAKVVIRSRLRELEAEFVVGIEGLRLEHPLLAHHCVRNVVAIHPSAPRACWTTKKLATSMAAVATKAKDFRGKLLFIVLSPKN